MRFIAPHWLWLLALVYGSGLVYLFQQLRRRNRYALRFSNLALLGSVAPRRPGWRRHVPAVLLLASLSAMVVSMARPTRVEEVPVERATVVMAIDVSISMDATDVQPTRIDAARAAAHAFVDRVPGELNLGLVSFAGTARIDVGPTRDRAPLHAALDGLTLREATAIGDAILASLAALSDLPGDRDTDDPVPAHIVLMSDGETTVGTPNEIAAAAAVEAGVPVSTIAFGTDEGIIEYQGQLIPVPANAPALERIAEETGGRFFRAVTGEELRAVYDDIGSAIGYEEERREVTTWFVGLAFLFGMGASGTSLLWFSRLP